ncbi:protease pro-enzyme activation domain-containing protein [Burkholderia alba]|uniref:protease pro-enzyme activation domain-containing protein n=1 Tax=Burkholderia alba TaxID=2683677 RepID=UPI002B054F73|nr:protease pro-enzyme activation domain-containing protein [Burkholderia alba]
MGFRHIMAALIMSAAVAVSGASFAHDAQWVNTLTISPLDLSGDGRPANGEAARVRQLAGHAVPVPAGQLFDIQILLKPQNPSRQGESGAGGLPADPRARAAERFAPAQAQVGDVVAYLTRSGFTRVDADASRFSVRAQGTAESISKAFHVGMKTFTYQDRRVFANDRTVQVPAYLGAVVGSVLGLQNLY